MGASEKTPTAENRWYVLATLAGEQRDDINYDLHKKNRRYWNAWASQNMTEEEKSNVKDANGNNLLSDAPEWPTVKDEVEKIFKERLPNATLPDPSEIVDFQNVEFKNNAVFDRFFFSAVADFDSAVFSAQAHFINAAFSGPSKFVKTNFKATVSFNDAVFEAPCNLREAKFEKFYPDLEGTLLHSKTNVTAEKAYWPPAQIYHSDKKALSSCAHLRQNMASQGLNEAAHFFFRREMNHKARSSQFWERPFYAIYRFSEYGYGVWQPFIAIVFLVLAGALSLVFWGGMQCAAALGLSFANIFRFFGFQRVYFDSGTIKDLPMWLELMTGSQTVIGYFLLFLFGLGLRNRFRLK